MANKLFNAVLAMKLAPSPKAVLLSLASRANLKNECWPSVRKIMEDTGLSRRTVFRSIAELRKLGLIARPDPVHPTKFRVTLGGCHIGTGGSATVTPGGCHNDTGECHGDTLIVNEPSVEPSNGIPEATSVAKDPGINPKALGEISISENDLKPLPEMELTYIIKDDVMDPGHIDPELINSIAHKYFKDTFVSPWVKKPVPTPFSGAKEDPAEPFKPTDYLVQFSVMPNPKILSGTIPYKEPPMKVKDVLLKESALDGMWFENRSDLIDYFVDNKTPTPRHLAAFWRKIMTMTYPDYFFPPLTMKQMGQLKNFVDKHDPNKSPYKTLGAIICNWDKFTTFVLNEAGGETAPTQATIGYVLANAGLAQQYATILTDKAAKATEPKKYKGTPYKPKATL